MFLESFVVHLQLHSSLRNVQFNYIKLHLHSTVLSSQLFRYIGRPSNNHGGINPQLIIIIKLYFHSYSYGKPLHFFCSYKNNNDPRAFNRVQSSTQSLSQESPYTRCSSIEPSITQLEREEVGIPII